MTKYLENDLSEERAIKGDGVIKEVMKALAPSMADADVQRDLVEMKQHVRKSNDALPDVLFCVSFTEKCAYGSVFCVVYAWRFWSERGKE